MNIKDCDIFSADDHNLKHTRHSTSSINTNGTFLDILIDSGTQFPIIDEKSFNTIMNKPAIVPTNFKCYGYQSKDEIEMVGESILTFYNSLGHQVKRLAYIPKGDGGNLMDMETATALGLVINGWKVEVNKVNAINTLGRGFEKQFPNVFSNKIGCLKDFEATLKIRSAIDPIAHSYRPVPYHQREAVEKELKRMEAADIIEPIPPNEHTEWILPMVIVTKEDGSKAL